LIDVLYKGGGFLSELSGFEHDVLGCALEIDVKSNLLLLFYRKVCDRFVGTEWSRVLEALLFPFEVVLFSEL